MRILTDPLIPAGRVRAWAAGICVTTAAVLSLVALFSSAFWGPMLVAIALLGATIGAAAIYYVNQQRYQALLPHANEILRKGSTAPLMGPMVAAAINAGASELRTDHDRAHFRKLAGKAAGHWTAMSERWINPDAAPIDAETEEAEARANGARRGMFDPHLVDFIREPARTALDSAAWIAFFRDMNAGALPLEDMRSADRIVRRLRGIFAGALRTATVHRPMRSSREHLALELILLTEALRAAKPASGQNASVEALSRFAPGAIECGEAIIARFSPSQADNHATLIQRFRDTSAIISAIHSEPAPAEAEPATKAVSSRQAAPTIVSEERSRDRQVALDGDETNVTEERVRPALPLPVAKQASSLTDLFHAARRRMEQQATRREGMIKKLPQFDLSYAVHQASEALERIARDAKTGDAVAQSILLTNDPVQTAGYLRQRRDERVVKLRAMYDDIIDENDRLASVALVNGDLDGAREALVQVVTGRPTDLDALGRLIEVQHLSGQLEDAERLAQRMMDMAGAEDQWEAVAYNHFGQVCQTKNDLDRAEDFYRKALSIAERIGSRPLVASGYSLLGQIHAARGDNERAAEMFRGAMAASDGGDGPARVRATAAGQLGTIYRGRGDLLKAEQMLRIAATTFTECASPASGALHLNTLGLIYKQRGDLERAEETYQQAITLNEQCNCEEGLAANLGNLSDVFQARGDINGAESLLRRSIDLFEKGNSPDGVAIAYAKLGTALHAKGDLAGAVDIFSISQAINEKLGNRERMATDLANLGLVLQSRGEAAQAEQVLLQALAIHEQLGDRQAIASTCNNLGLTCDRLGDKDRAEQLYKRALDLLENAGDDGELARVHTNLGNLYLGRGNVKPAEDHLAKALSLHEDLGSLHGIAANCDALAEIFKNRGDLDQAEEMLRNAMAALAKLGSDAGMAVAHAKLGAVYRTRGDLPAAAEMFREAIVLDERRGATNDLAANCGNLGLLYRGMGQLDLAERLLRRALDLYERLGREDNVAVTYSHLGSLEIERGHTPNAKQLWTQALALYQKLGRQDTVRSLRGRLESLSGV